MKKFIAMLLALVMCLSLFAACGNTEDTTGTTGTTAPTEPSVNEEEAVQKAADYVKSMYLGDTREPIKVDFALTSVVSTADGNFTVEWTVDMPDMVTITPAENEVKITIEKYPAEEYTFTLNGTVKSASGKTATVTLKYTVPQAAGTAATLADGTYVISTNGLSFAALAESYNYGYAYPNEVTIADGVVTSFVDTDVITITNVEGGVTLQDCFGRYIYMKGDYNSYNVSKDMPAEGHIWTVLSTAEGFILTNAMNGKTIAYSQSYTSWGAYAETTDDHLTVLSIIAVNPDDAGAAGPEYGAEYADKEISIETALDIAANIGGAGTTYKVYITGTVTEIASDVYGNLYITDGTHTIYVYGVYDADGTNRYDAMENAPQVGSVVKLYGILMQYGETQQMKNAWVISCEGGETPAPECEHAYVDGTCTKCGEADPNYNPNPDTNNDPAADSTLTIADAIALGASKEHDTYTEGKYYVTGVIVEVYNTTYGNMKITDEAGNILTIYGTYDADGTNRYDAMTTKPVAGDTVTIYGIIGQYNNTPQIKNGWIVAHTPAEVDPTPDPNPNPSGLPFEDGDKIVIVCGAYGKALSSQPSSAGSYYQMGVDVTVKDGTVSGYADTEVWTVIANDDGTYSFSYNGQNLGMQDSYSSMSLGAVNDKWELVALENGTYALKNVVRGNYIEWYADKNNWSTYTTEDLLGNTLFQLSFFVVG